MATITEAKPPRIFPILLQLIAVPLVLNGVQLIFLGGSFYYLFAGIMLVACGRSLWRKDPAASLIYGSFMLVTVVWSFYEAGTDLWALVPRILPFGVLGCWFLTPWLRRPLYQGNPPPLFETTIFKATVGIAALITIFVFVVGTGYEVKPLSARAETSGTSSWMASSCLMTTLTCQC